MKLSLNIPRKRPAGFTLVEMYVVLAVFSFLLIAIVATQFFAARVYTLAATKLTSTASGRKAMNDMRDQIREASSVQVGIYNPANNTFTNIPIGTAQIGNALVIYSNNPNAANTLINMGSTNLGVIYFMNQQRSNMCSVIVSNGTVLSATLASNIVNYITNYYVFDAEDAFTNIMTTYVKNRLIHVKLQYCQWEYPLAGVGGGAMYDYYQLQTRAAPRIINY
jgi:prepilin-type N-terminal cleavage/methylation domain-containing protein